MTASALPTRQSQAQLERVLRAALKMGRVVAGAKHHPNGVVEFTFSDGTAHTPSLTNPWDTP